MRITIPAINVLLSNLIDIETLKILKDEPSFTLTIQNLWDSDIFLENNVEASVETWYKLLAWNEVEINYINIERFNVIAQTENTNIRYIIT